MAEVKPPEGLGPRGTAFWHAVMHAYEPNIDELELLTEVCRTLDLIETLHGRLDEPGVVTEIRLQRALFSRLLVMLGLERDDGETMLSPASQRGRRAAKARWSRRVTEPDAAEAGE